MYQDPYLPPGCSVNDIPGSRPCDAEVEVTVQLTLCRSEVEEITEAGREADCWEWIALQVVSDIEAAGMPQHLPTNGKGR